MATNESGILPVEYKVLIKVEAVERKTAGGIILPEDYAEKEEMAQIKAILIDMGGSAFTDWQGRKPQPGDRVIVAKYSGQEMTGLDGETYRLANDKDIAAILVN